MFTKDQALELLTKANMFFGEDEPGDGFEQMLNMSDTWMWGCADGEPVADEELPEVAELFWMYGYCGVLYWVAKKRGYEGSEFHDITRFVQFVKHEEELRALVPDSSKRAYTTLVYELGNKERETNV